MASFLGFLHWGQLSRPGGKRWKVAREKWEEAYIRAIRLRVIAGKYEEQEKLARRLYDAKMQRLDNGDKLKRRKSPFRAACRTYEAIIDLNEAQLKCAWARCEAAEAERHAAEVRGPGRRCVENETRREDGGHP